MRYSLTLFNATRVEPLSIGELKRYFVESEPKKAESVMERFLKACLVHKTEDGKFYSNFPDNFINYSDYRYDGDLEAKKDAKVFQLMKEHSGKKEFWKDKSYFSIDAFFTEDQSKEIQEMLRDVKLKAKQFATENDKIGLKGMKFRRFKFYDLFWSIFLFTLTFSLTSLQISSTAFARVGGSGNDPTNIAFAGNIIKPINIARFSGGSGNDPTAFISFPDDAINEGGGGGHDPDTNGCKVIIRNTILNGVFDINEESCIILDNQLTEQ